MSITEDSTPCYETTFYAPISDGLSIYNTTVKQIRGLVFDMDGTLIEPIYSMFQKMRDALGIGESVDILTHIDTLEGVARTTAEAKIEEIEHDAMLSMALQPGLTELLLYTSRLPEPPQKAILTRNNPKPVDYLLQHHLPPSEHSFSPILTREFRPFKPSPAPLLYISEQWMIPPDEIMMIGDGKDDIRCGYTAGSVTCLVVNEGMEDKYAEVESMVDLRVNRIDEIIEILERGFKIRRLAHKN